MLIWETNNRDRPVGDISTCCRSHRQDMLKMKSSISRVNFCRRISMVFSSSSSNLMNYVIYWLCKIMR